MSNVDALPRNAANHVPLTPLGFIAWSAYVYPERIALIHGALRQTWHDTYLRCRRMAAALQHWGVARGDVVAVLAPNTPALYEAHFGVPMSGAVLNALNTRLDAPTLAYILDHGRAQVLLYDSEFAPLVRDVIAQATHPIRVVRIEDALFAGEHGDFGDIDYETWLSDAVVADDGAAARHVGRAFDTVADGTRSDAGPADAGPADAQAGPPAAVPSGPSGLPQDYSPPDEWDAICLNYTSGTTGRPKGVVYHHRGAYLNSTGNVIACGMPRHAVYLWTLPMFHCNGWCFAWTLAALAGTSVCMRRVEAGPIFDAIVDHNVGFFSAAPVVLGMLINAPAAVQRRAPHPVQVVTGGAAPPAAVIEAMEALGVGVSHLYGLTETYGPSIVCAWHDDWDALDLTARAAIKARIGVRKLNLEHATVMDDGMQPVPADGVTMGEIMVRGNTIMKGYLHDAKATEAAFAGGWFHTGDLGVMHPDGYIEIKDRAKDIVISGGENISTVEVEGVLYRHPDVLEAAVVARPDATWGETPCAFVTLKAGRDTDAESILAFCRAHLARFKVPKTVVFGDLPKTSTGKIQKFLLRERARAGGTD
ncbi:AMP-binding protein [Alcaligenaceae bacterium A4P071]|nr:AMP-binding protein [Alcaligenaceae bacterium A4P071]